MQSLPLIEIFITSIRLAAKKSKLFFKFGSPFVLIGLILFLFINASIFESDANIFIDIAIFILEIGIFATAVMAIVGCHRVFLLNETEVLETKVLRLGGRELRFIGWWIVIGLCVSIVVIPMLLLAVPLVLDFIDNTFSDKDVAGNIIVPLMGLPVYYLVARWSLLLPATAIDQRPNLGWAWSLSKGNSMRLTLLVGIVPLVSAILMNFLSETDSIIYKGLVEMVWLVVMVVEIGLLSLSYQWLVGTERGESESRVS